jgi:hypothetical protein
VIQVQVGTADAGTRDAHDGIAWMFDDRIGLVIGTDPVRPAVIHCQHISSSMVNGPTVQIRPSTKRYVKTLRKAIRAWKRAQVSEQFS